MSDEGSWVVTLEPHPFLPRRIPPGRLRDAIGEASVSLRGWDYPHIDKVISNIGADGIECETDYLEHKERWRLRTSGLFSHRWLMWEDYYEKSRGTLSALSALWSLTEICEFSSRLYGEDPTVTEVQVSIVFSQMAQRRLQDAPDERFVGRVGQPPRDSTFELERLFGREDLRNDPRALARSLAVDLFFFMGAEAPIEEWLRVPQENLYQLHLGRS